MNKFDSFLKNIILIEIFNLEIPLSTNDLVEKWKVVLYKDQSGFLGDKYSSKSKFIGEVDLQGFKCRKDFRSMNKDKVSVSAKGSFADLANKTKIGVTINGLDFMTKIYYSLIIVFFFNAFFFNVQIRFQS